MRRAAGGSWRAHTLSTRPDEDLLNDILRAAQRIERRLQGVEREQFMDDDVLQDAIVLQLP